MSHNIKLTLAILIGLCTPHVVHGQFKRLGENIEYKTSISSTFSDGEYAPFWMTNNKYGLSTINNNSGYLRGGIFRDVKTDNGRNWRIGYGADIAFSLGMDRTFVVQQLYADFQWKALRLNVGQKEREMELRNQLLSSGAMASGINARPLPQVRIELPEFWTIPGTKEWLAIKAHIAYGAYTDNAWQKEFHEDPFIYSANSLFHSKAGFVRIGNTEKFPITLTGGFEMDAQFGGEAWNLLNRADANVTIEKHQKLGNGAKAFWNAFIPGGSDVNDGDFKNAAGNQLGSFHLSADYHGNHWGARFYAEHFYDDHSQLFWQYGWKDMLYGLEINLPKNHFVNSFLYEHIGTTDQSGSIYHDATETLPVQISAVDEYYNHHIYGAWQHAGFVMGNPLLISPLYNANGRIFCYHNRINAHHFGISGQPTNEIGYRVLFTHEKSLGTYNFPLENPAYGNFLIAEGSYSPHQIPGLNITLSYGQNGGQLLGHSKGALLSISYSGWINKKQ